MDNHRASAHVQNQTASGGVTFPSQDSDVNSVQSDISHSWHKPQIYLAASASGKSTISYYDVTGFVADNTQEEILIESNDSQVILGLVPIR